MKKIILILSIIITAFTWACNSSNESKKVDNGTAFRKGDLFSENVDLGTMPKEEGQAPGQNQTYERSFENAPPLIPHSIDAFTPITLKNNMCLSCHMPDKASAVGSTPIPASHFTVFRPEIRKEGGKYILYENNQKVEIKNLGDKLDMARYNCTQCHVVQTNAKLDVRNLFKPEFRDTTGKHRSNLLEKVDEGVK